MWANNSPTVAKAAGESMLAFRAGDAAAAAAAATGDGGGDGRARDTSRAFGALAASAAAAAGPRRLAASASARRLAVGAAIVAVVVLTVLSLVLDAAHEVGPRQYAADLRSMAEYDAVRCDEPLGSRHLFSRARVVSHAMCAHHRSTASGTDPPQSDNNFRHGNAAAALHDLRGSRLAFLVVGDWGRDGMCCQRDVAAEMAIAARELAPAFVANVGDSFYPFGIQTMHDDQINTSWRDVYVNPHEPMHRVPWKTIGGNHDYHGRIDAQLDLAKTDSLWHFPARYYFEEVNIVNGTILLAFLDTTPMYYSEEELRNFQSFSDVDLGNSTRDEQLEDLRARLKSSKAKIKLVFGHHPLVSSSQHGSENAKNSKRMQSLLLKIFVDYKITAYFAGHEHTMEHSVIKGTHFIISGAGSKVSALETAPNGNVFALDRHGFVAAAVFGNTLRVRFVDYLGASVHSVDIPAR